MGDAWNTPWQQTGYGQWKPAPPEGQDSSSPGVAVASGQGANTSAAGSDQATPQLAVTDADAPPAIVPAPGLTDSNFPIADGKGKGHDPPGLTDSSLPTADGKGKGKDQGKGQNPNSWTHAYAQGPPALMPDSWTHHQRPAALMIKGKGKDKGKSEPDRTKLFVGNLPLWTEGGTQAALRNWAEEFGPVGEFRLHTSRPPRGDSQWAFLQFRRVEHAEYLQRCDGMHLVWPRGPEFLRYAKRHTLKITFFDDHNRQIEKRQEPDWWTMFRNERRWWTEVHPDAQEFQAEAFSRHGLISTQRYNRTDQTWDNQPDLPDSVMMYGYEQAKKMWEDHEAKREGKGGKGKN